jgi:hypothetical protein
MKTNGENHHSEDNRIRARFDEKNIRVYQAYNHTIADEAIKLGTFGTHFQMDRMTWIKPSFLWMMYRSGWATKEGQEKILAIDIKRTGFDTLLENVVLSTYRPEIYGDYTNWKKSLENSEVRCQWDPDRDIFGNPLDIRAIQLGLKGRMVENYVTDWIVKISDITDTVIGIRESIKTETFDKNILPKECEYPLSERLQRTLGIII